MLWAWLYLFLLSHTDFFRHKFCCVKSGHAFSPNVCNASIFRFDSGWNIDGHFHLFFSVFLFSEELYPVLPGKWKMFSYLGMTDSFNKSIMLRFYLPHYVLSIGCKIPKVINLEVHGELVEGNVIRGHAKVAWCGGIPGKGVSRWACFLNAHRICCVCMSAWHVRRK